MEKKQKAAAEAEAKANASAAKADAPKDDGKKADSKDDKSGGKRARRSTIAGWWSSWKTFSHQNK